MVKNNHMARHKKSQHGHRSVVEGEVLSEIATMPSVGGERGVDVAIPIVDRVYCEGGLAIALPPFFIAELERLFRSLSSVFHESHHGTKHHLRLNGYTTAL